MIKKFNDFERNMLLMAGSAMVGMMYSYILYNNITNNAFTVASILAAFFLGAFILSFSVRTIINKKKAKNMEDNASLDSVSTKNKNMTETKKGFYYGKKSKK